MQAVLLYDGFKDDREMRDVERSLFCHLLAPILLAPPGMQPPTTPSEVLVLSSCTRHCGTLALSLLFLMYSWEKQGVGQALENTDA